MCQSGFTLSQLSSALKAHCYWYGILDLVTGGRCPNCFVSDSGPGIYQAFNEHRWLLAECYLRHLAIFSRKEASKETQDTTDVLNTQT